MIELKVSKGFKSAFQMLAQQPLLVHHYDSDAYGNAANLMGGMGGYGGPGGHGHELRMGGAAAAAVARQHMLGGEYAEMMGGSEFGAGRRKGRSPIGRVPSPLVHSLSSLSLTHTRARV